MLEERDAPFEFRHYLEDPLRPEEVRHVLKLLKVGADEFLRSRDKAYEEEGLTGSEDEDTLVSLLARHPGLLQRPIALRGHRALIARPPERVLELL